MDKDFLKSFFTFIDAASNEELIGKRFEVESLMSTFSPYSKDLINDAKFLIRRIDVELGARFEVQELKQT